MPPARHGGLGRGLGALIANTPAPGTEAAAPGAVPAPPEVRRVPVGSIRAGVWQPRRQFRPEPLDELVASIRARGVLQPLLVRAAGDGYELIAGERRLRAATAAGLAEVPVKVMQVDDREALELALVENLQREDLDPIEEAEGYRSLLERFQLTQEQIAERVGKARATVANALRLLALPADVRRMVEEGALSAGHAKALLGLALPAEQSVVAGRVAKEALSVRATEKLVARLGRPPRKPRAFRPDVPEVQRRHLEEQMREKLGTAVAIHPSRTLSNGRRARGTLVIDFHDADDLDRLLLLLGITDSF